MSATILNATFLWSSKSPCGCEWKGEMEGGTKKVQWSMSEMTEIDIVDNWLFDALRHCGIPINTVSHCSCLCFLIQEKLEHWHHSFGIWIWKWNWCCGTILWCSKRPILTDFVFHLTKRLFHLGIGCILHLVPGWFVSYCRMCNKKSMRMSVSLHYSWLVSVCYHILDVDPYMGGAAGKQVIVQFPYNVWALKAKHYLIRLQK